jgi:hypothetical protein
MGRATGGATWLIYYRSRELIFVLTSVSPRRTRAPALIGVGGMGEVYKATDINLKRAVAIKVLPASVAGDTERRARFQREAQVLAALDHPNIAAIYGLEKSRSGGSSDPPITALVMELVEGDDTLAAYRARRNSHRGGAAHRQADRGGAGSGARARHRSPRSEAREYQSARRQDGEGARLRAGEGAGACSGGERERDEFPDAVVAGDAGWENPRHGRVHEPGAGARAAQPHSA